MTPAASMPGVSGTGTFIWYAPLVCSRSANDTPAATTPITKPSSAAGSATSAQTTSSGPVSLRFNPLRDWSGSLRDIRRLS
jgi:hypothetical protein